MKKILFIAIGLLVISGMLLTGCSKAASTTTATTPPTSTAPSPTPTTPVTPQPVSGGTLRILASSGPQVLSYVPLMGPGDRAEIFEGAEALVDTNSARGEMSGGVEPVLAQ